MSGHTVFVPAGHAAYIYPVPAISDSADDDGSQIIDYLATLEAGHNRGAGAHVRQLLDNNEIDDEGEDG